jgi:MoaA/NifB/PqqE/SkfB family radical SAM enzyme
VSRLETSCDVVVFCSSSGHCQLDCDYCVVHPVIKRNPSLTYEDLAWFLGEIGTRAFLMFSGKGDFFAGYPKRDRLLDRLLGHDVEVALDVNGVLLNEYPELSEEKLAKIRYINLTMHYRQIREKRVEKLWVENAKTILARHRGALLLGTILSPLGEELWEEALAFYEREIFEPTGQRLWAIRDCERTATAEQAARLDALEARYAHLIERSHTEDFAAAFAGKEFVLCPAGKDYFRIWNDGRVEGCPYIPELGDAGNVKERRLVRRGAFFRCSTPRFCDCNNIEALGKMRYDAPEAAPAASTRLPVYTS